MSAASLQEVLGRSPVHPFPARMAPGLARDAFLRLSPRATVLDPMAGSGTVLALARATGHRCIGFDVDPLAVLISRVWTRTIDEDRVRAIARRVLTNARGLAPKLAVRDAYPIGSDKETRAFVRYWFDDYVRRQLTALSVSIRRVKSKTIQDVLWCAFSRLIIAKQSGVSLALDLAHSRPHRKFDRAPRKPFRLFLEAVDKVIEGCVQQSSSARGPVATIKLGDVRKLPLPDRSIDLVFTSPPYLNAIDYLRCSKFSLVWMGYSISALRAIRSSSIGAEISGEPDSGIDKILGGLCLRPALSPRLGAVLRNYAKDTDRALREVARVLTPKGRAVYVLGENTVRGTYIPTARLVVNLAAKAGLRLLSKRSRHLPRNRRYLPPPGMGQSSMDTRIRREAILTFAGPRASRPKSQR